MLEKVLSYVLEHSCDINPAMFLLQTLISVTAMYESALLQGQPAPNAAEFNTYAFIMLLIGTRQKDGPTAFFQVSCTYGELSCL